MERGLAATEHAPKRVTVQRLLLMGGAISSVLYVATDVIASMRYAGYSYVDQSFSELLAIGAPTRPFVFPLALIYNLLVLAFAVGVWRAAAGNRALRITSVMLLFYGTSSLIGPFVPMNVRGTGFAFADLLHVICTAVLVLSVMLAMGFGAAALGKRFRICSIASLVAVLGFGVLAGMQGSRIAAGLATPWVGVVERVNIYAIMLWVLVLGVALLRVDAAPEPVAMDAEQSGRKKKVTVFVGSGHAGGATRTAARMLVEGLESFGDVEGEIVALSEYDVGVCRGCKACFERGEDRCPLRDDRDALIGKMEASDAIVFASPNYSFQVSGLMKVFLDRLGFLFHRPRFHGKSATAIVVQGMFGGRRIRKYLEFAAGGLGFKTVKGSVIHTLEPMTEEALRKRDDALRALSRRLHEQLLRPARPTPSLIELMAFRMSRTGIRLGTADDSRDRAYYRDRGWFESDYYYPTHLGPLKRIAGAVFDWAGARIPTFKVARVAEPGA